MVYCLTNGAFGLLIIKIYPFCQRIYIRKQGLLLQCQNLKMRHSFLGVEL